MNADFMRENIARFYPTEALAPFIPFQSSSSAFIRSSSNRTLRCSTRQIRVQTIAPDCTNTRTSL